MLGMLIKVSLQPLDHHSFDASEARGNVNVSKI